MQDILNNKRAAILFIAFSLIITLVSVTPSVSIKVMGVGILSLVFIIKMLATIRPNIKSVAVLLIAMIYVNLLNPIPAAKFLPILLDGVIVLLVIRVIREQGLKINKWLSYLVTALLLLATTQLFNPNVPMLIAGLEGFRKTAFYFMLLLLGLFLPKREGDVLFFCKIVSLASIPVLLYGIKQHFFYTTFDDLYLLANNANKYTGMLFGQFRSTSIFSGPFHFGMYSAVIALCSSFTVFLVKSKREKALYFLISLISFVSCYSSMTRTNLIALIISYLMFYLLSSGGAKLVARKVLLSTLLILTSIMYLIMNGSKLLTSESGMIYSIINANQDTRFLGRIEGWLSILRLSTEKPFTAYGMGAAGDTMGSIYNYSIHVTSHNIFLKNLLEMGVFGLLLTLCLYGTLMIKLMTKITSKKLLDDERNFALFGFCVLLVLIIVGMTIASIETYPVAGLILFTVGYAIQGDIMKSR